MTTVPRVGRCRQQTRPVNRENGEFDAENTGCRTQPPGFSSQIEKQSFKPERTRKRGSLWNVGVTEGGEKRCGQPNWNKTSPPQIVWLPGRDSNSDSRLQRPLSYH